jgi:hypothetical protein
MFQFRKRKTSGVQFCERCGSVCDAACRAEASRQQVRAQAFQHGWRIA